LSNCSCGNLICTLFIISSVIFITYKRILSYPDYFAYIYKFQIPPKATGFLLLSSLNSSLRHSLAQAGKQIKGNPPALGSGCPSLDNFPYACAALWRDELAPKATGKAGYILKDAESH